MDTGSSFRGVGPAAALSVSPASRRIASTALKLPEGFHGFLGWRVSINCQP